ncbi:MAG: helix-turn-helix transcriptional regulator [Mangrovibacterium sp.]|nr:helix-turn-helix transcriptional regulator [Mangrovibacterium sp.]
METKTGNKHMGKQVKRFREAIGMKQETLAGELGTSQQNISYYEKQEDIDNDLFTQLAKGMGVSPEVLQDYNAEAPIFNIQEARENAQTGYIYNFNPIDKILEQSSKIEELYKALLKSEQDKVEILSGANNDLRTLVEEFRKLKKETR